MQARCDARLGVLGDELAIVKNCIMQLYNVLLPGKLPGTFAGSGGNWNPADPSTQVLAVVF